MGSPSSPPRRQCGARAEATGTYFHGFENFAIGKGHWNLAGHAFAAELLADELFTRGLLP